jgi:hypothetical protein
MKTWQILTNPCYRQRKNRLMSVHVYYTHTCSMTLVDRRKEHAVKITWKQQLPNKTVFIDHCTIHMREYNPVCNRINWIITAKSPIKFNSRTCRENLTTTYGNHVISTGGKIQIKHGGKFAVTIPNSRISQQFLFVNICAYTVTDNLMVQLVSTSLPFPEWFIWHNPLKSRMQWCISLSSVRLA